MKNLVLFGFKAAGKTTLGRALAHRLDQCFIDTDDWIELEYAREHNKPLSCKEIAIKHGEVVFRQLEQRVIASLIGQKKAVIAVGGGAILCQKNQQVLASLGELIFLDVAQEVLKMRLSHLPIPYYLENEPFDAAFERVYQERLVQYKQIPASHLYFASNGVWEVCDGE